MTTITHEARNFSHGGKLYAYTGVNTDGGVTCAGCGKTLKNFKGLMTHQKHRHAAMACQPTPASFADLEAPRYFIDGVEATPEQAAEQAAIDAEPYSDAHLAAGLQEHFDECAKAVFTNGEDEAEFVTRVETAGQDEVIKIRDEVIANARRYARVPEFTTTLVHLVGGEHGTPTAWRWHPEDAEKLTVTAFSSSVVRITKHGEGRKGETVVTDFEWLDGLRARVTEKFAI